MNTEEARKIVRDVVGPGAPDAVIEHDGYWVVTFERDRPGGVPLGSPSFVVLADGRYAPFLPGRRSTSDVVADLLAGRAPRARPRESDDR